MVIKAPIANKKPKKMTLHGHTRVDDYYWMNQREDPEVIKYLKQENQFLKKSLKHTDPLQKELFKEIKGRIKEKDESVPYLKDGYFHYHRFEKGKEYPLICRKKESLKAKEEIILDENKLAVGHEYFALKGYDLSKDQNLVAYAVDTIGRRIYDIKIRDLNTGKDLDDFIPQVSGNFTWANDNKTLFYSNQDPQTLRTFKVFRHEIGTDSKDDVLVFEEKDETFNCYVSKTKSDQYLIIGSYQTLSSECWILEADEPLGEFRLFQKRERDHEYSIDHFEDRFFIITNSDAQNFRLMESGLQQTKKENWIERLAHRPDVLLEDLEIFKDYLVIEERKNGLTHLRIQDLRDNSEHYLDFGEQVYTATISVNEEFDTGVLRFSYTSLTTPPSTFDYNMDSRAKTLKKEMEVLGGFDKKNYHSERIQVKVRDGIEVPISLVYRKDLYKKGENPCILYGYGSYGATIDPVFSSARLSMIDRGFVFAIAHVRGGQINGRQWYEDGKLLKKKNTFYDFVDCSKELLKKGYSKPGGLYAVGGSAGGLLMGAVINLAPELYNGVVASVPFVDVVTTMLDESIPLTTGEFDEWGNPKEKEYYDYILSYSPYDNVESKKYPNMLITTGLHDSQVQYWEPAKWVAKLRELKQGERQLFLHTNMDAGHGGSSGRFRRFREVALEYAFFLNLENPNKTQ
jgi:oligopeptidase B